MKLKGPVFVQCLSYFCAFVEIVKFYEDDFIRENKKFHVVEREKYFVNPPEERKIKEGMRRLMLFEDIIFNRFKYKPHYFQRNFLQLIVMGLAEKLIGKEEWLQVGNLIKKK